MNHATALLAAVLGFWSASSLAQKAEMPAPENFNVGDTWEWRQVDNLTKLEIAKFTRTFVVTKAGPRFNNGKVNFLLERAYVGPPKAEKPWRVWPLEVGRKWVHDSNFTRADNGVTGNTKQDAHVAAYEEVSVPAGKYMAFRIEYKGNFRNSQGSSGAQTETYWYAPEVHADVKRTYDDGYEKYTVELVAYRRGAAQESGSK